MTPVPCAHATAHGCEPGRGHSRARRRVQLPRPSADAPPGPDAGAGPDPSGHRRRPPRRPRPRHPANRPPEARHRAARHRDAAGSRADGPHRARGAAVVSRPAGSSLGRGAARLGARRVRGGGDGRRDRPAARAGPLPGAHRRRRARDRHHRAGGRRHHAGPRRGVGPARRAPRRRAATARATPRRSGPHGRQPREHPVDRRPADPGAGGRLLRRPSGLGRPSGRPRDRRGLPGQQPHRRLRRGRAARDPRHGCGRATSAPSAPAATSPRRRGRWCWSTRVCGSGSSASTRSARRLRPRPGSRARSRSGCRRAPGRSTGPTSRTCWDAVRRLERRVDAVVVLPHWGEQYTHAAWPVQRLVGRRLVEAGADLVVGGHPHWVQGLDHLGAAPCSPTRWATSSSTWTSWSRPWRG